MASSYERKYMSFKVLQSVLPTLTAKEVGAVFSSVVVEEMTLQCKHEGKSLHSVVKELLSGALSLVETTTDQRLLASLAVHLQRRTRGDFDKVMSCELVKCVHEHLTGEGVGYMLEEYVELFGLADRDEKLWVLDQVLGMVRGAHLPRAGDWLVSCAVFLMGHAFFDLTAHQSPDQLPVPLKSLSEDIPPSVRGGCVSRFSSAIKDLNCIVLPMVGGKPLPPGVAEDGRPFMTRVVEAGQHLVKSCDMGVVQCQPFSEEEKEAWSSITASIEKIEEKGDGIERAEKAFLLLFSLSALMLLTSTDRNQSVDTISELVACHNDMEQEVRLSKSRTPRKKKKPGADGTKWVEVLTDLLLGQLLESSQLWRTVAEQSYRLLSSSVTSGSIELILKVLKPKQPKEELLEGDSEEEDGEEKEEEGDEQQQDEEIEDMEDDGEDTEGEEEEEEGVESGGVDQEFAEKVRRALGAAAVNSDGESESSMDDDAMMAVDEALGQVFKTRFALKHQKKQQMDDEKSLLNFKLRALDLLEVFIRRESTNPLILELVAPMFEVVHVSQNIKTQVPLTNKCAAIFQAGVCRAKQYPRVGVDYARVHEQLQELIKYLHKATSTTTPLLTGGIMFFMKVLRNSHSLPEVSPLTTRAGRKRKQKQQEKEEPHKDVDSHGELNVSMVTEWLSEPLHDFITVKSSSVPPQFYLSYCQRYPLLAVLLAPQMVHDLPEVANNFKKVQVHSMVALLHSSVGEDNSVWSGLDQTGQDTLRSVLTETPPTTKLGSSARRKMRKKKLKNSQS